MWNPTHNVELLLSRIQSLCLDTYRVFFADFDITLRKMAQMDLGLWSQLQIILITDEKKQFNSVVREFLSLRGKIFVNTSFDYTHAPNLLANQLSVDLARSVIKDNEALCQLLMPTIVRVYGTHFMPTDIVSATSESEDDPFLWENYLTHVDGSSLIYIPGLYQISARDPDFLFSPKPELLILTPEDYERIRTVAGFGSERYFGRLKEMHRIMHNEKNSVGYALKVLQCALVASSKQSAGTEFQACMIQLHRPILDFYRIWISLPAALRNKIALYTETVTSRSLESYLLFLFLHAKAFHSEISVTENDYRRVIRESIFPCVDLVSQNLDGILKTHLDLFDMLLPDAQTNLQKDHVPTSDELSVFHETLKTALLSRVSIRGLSDLQCLAYVPFATILASCFSNLVSMTKISSLISATKNADDVVSVLYLSASKNQQVSYLRQLRLGSTFYFICNPCQVITKILNRLNPETWQVFFETMNKIIPGIRLEQSHLIGILNSVPQKQWSELIKAMHPCLISLFSKETEIAYFFSEMFYHQYTIDQTYKLFRDALDIVLSNLKNMISLLRYSSSEVWPVLIRVLKAQFELHCKNESFEVNVLQQLSSDEKKIEFLKVLFFNFSDSIKMPPLKISRLMNMLSFETAKQFLNLLNPRQFEFIRSAKELAAFLQLLNNSKRQLIFIKKIQDVHIKMEVDMRCFYYLIRKYPDATLHFVDCFSKYIPTWFHDLIDVANNSAESTVKRSEAKIIFNFLVNRVLPGVFSYQNLKKQCPSLDSHSTELIRKIADKMDEIASDVSQCPLGACFSVMALFQEFLKAPREAHLAMNCDVLATELRSFFGGDFFDKLFNNTDFVMSSGRMIAEFRMKSFPVGARFFCGSHFFSQVRTDQSHVPSMISVQNNI